MSAVSACSAAVQAFGERTFERWHGLPHECRLDDLVALAPLLNQGVARGRRGRRERWLLSRMVTFEAYVEPVRAWFDEQEMLVLLEADYPTLPTGPEWLIQALGEPEARLDSYLDLVLLRGGEWAYPSRGLSIALNVETGRLLRLAVYAATSLETYLDDLRLDTTPGDLQR